MMPSLATELALLLVLSAAIFLPGSAILVLSGIWQRWSGLQRWFVAVGLGLSFYPILYYTTRALLPQLQLGRWVLLGLLAISLAITIWGIWRERVFLFLPDRLEWAAIIILGLTVASRLWFAHAHPFPAWSDSLHHTLLTDLTAEAGRLPRTLEPYFPNVLDMYHLGLYALSGAAQSLSGAPPHTALLWTAQLLNGLCGIGIYLVLDRHAGRVGAVAGLAVAGLFSAHPALWANWGRFTQLASVVLLPLAWAFFLELVLLRRPGEDRRPKSRHYIWLVLFAASSAAAVFLYHFRVGLFYVLLLGASTAVLLLKFRSRESRVSTLRALLLTSAGMLIIILPALLDAAASYLDSRLASTGPPDPEAAQQVLQNYYVFPLSSVPYLAAPVWLLVLGGLAGLVGLITRNSLIIICLLWALLMGLVGNLYLLDVPALNVTNLGAILIMLYIPIAVAIGAALEEGHRRLPDQYRAPALALFIIAITVVGLLVARTRANAVESYRHFVAEPDIMAMEWIDDHVPADATFAINIYQWLPRFAHGTDAGYWIPYFTERQIVTSAMLGDGLPGSYKQLVQSRSQAAEALETDLNALATLRELGVEYIYIGATGDFSGPGLRLDYLTQSDQVKVLYNQGGAAVLQILPGE